MLGITGYKNTTIEDRISETAKRDVGWSYEKVWEAYPYEVPKEYFFEEIRLRSKRAVVHGRDGQFHLDDGNECVDGEERREIDC